MAEITNTEEFESWLKDRDVTIAAALAHRFAARVLPRIIKAKAVVGWSSVKVFPIYRATLTSRLAVMVSSRDTAARAYSAAVAADAEIVCKTLADDCSGIEAGMTVGDIMNRPLWPDQPVPPEITKNWAEMKKRLRSAPDDWQVWIEWYQDMIDGKPDRLIPLLAQKTEETQALFPSDEEWKKGPSYINPLLERLLIEAKMAKPLYPWPSLRPRVGDDGRATQGPAPDPIPVEDALQDVITGEWRGLSSTLSFFEEVCATKPSLKNSTLYHAIPACREAMGSSFQELDVDFLGVVQKRLQAQVPVVRPMIREDWAADYEEFVKSISDFIDKFQSWQAQKSIPLEEMPEETLNALKSFARRLDNFPDIIDPKLAKAFRETAGAIDEIPEDPAHKPDRLYLETNLLRNVTDLAHTIFGAIYRNLSHVGRSVGRGALKGVGNATAKGVEKLVSNAAMALLLSQDYSILVKLLPKKLGFLQTVFQEIRNQLKKAKAENKGDGVSSDVSDAGDG